MSAGNIDKAATQAEYEQSLQTYIDALLLEPEHTQSTPAKTSEECIASEDDLAIEYMMFKVATFLILAIPMFRVNDILPWHGELTNVARPEDPEWFMGLFYRQGELIKVIDLARFVIPESHESRCALEDERHFRHLLLIDDGKLALACDGLDKVLTLTDEKICWRQNQSRRPWLAGTIVEHMCPLLDIERLTEMLKREVSMHVISPRV